MTDTHASPGLTVGRGLKPARSIAFGDLSKASPGLTVGRGLKPADADPALGGDGHRPASRSGAD